SKYCSELVSTFHMNRPRQASAEVAIPPEISQVVNINLLIGVMMDCIH
ncbi:MAG: hypothetical protein ACI8VW_001622, partial [bacterium]